MRRLSGKLRELQDLVMLKHTVFALPFAFLGAFLAAGGPPPARVAAWVLVAMVGARTCAMAFNRLVDQRFDALNARTADRALPAGRLGSGGVWALAAATALLFVVACAQLNPQTARLSLPLLAVALGYSFTKRFTWLSHVALGSALALAPLGGWVAVRGSLIGYSWLLSAGVVLWVAGFDVVYACQDLDFDRRAGLRSLPARFGVRTAFRVARWLHAAAFVSFAGVGALCGLGWPYAAGMLLVGAALVEQHRVVGPGDLVRLHRAFFQMNGAVSMTLFAAAALALALGGAA